MDISPLEELLEESEMLGSNPIIVGISKHDAEARLVIAEMARASGLSRVIVITHDDKHLRDGHLPLGLLELAELSESVKVHEHLHLIEEQTKVATKNVRCTLFGTTRLSSKSNLPHLPHLKRGRR